MTQVFFCNAQAKHPAFRDADMKSWDNHCCRTELNIMKNLKYILLILLCFPLCPEAAVTLDGTVGPAGQTTLTGPDYLIRPEYGHQAGGNLFHSFLRFGIDTGESVTFSGPLSVRNIISRVTGGEISRIDGMLRSLIPEADLYLLNPAGVIFGPGAALDLGGAFHVSTADYLRMGEEGPFYSQPHAGEILSVSPPSAFGFLKAGEGENASLVFDAARMDFSDKTFSLIGGDIRITNRSGLNLNGGQLNIAAVSGEGEVVPGEGGPDVSSFSEMGYTEISGGSGGMPTEVDVRYGSIYIRSGTFVADHSEILADIPYTAADPPPAVFDIAAEKVEIRNGSILSTDTFGRVPGADMHIRASESLCISGSRIRVGSIGSKASADAGSLYMEAPDIRLEAGSEIQSESQGKSAGNAGNINLKAENSLHISDTLLDTYTTGVGNAGNVNLQGADIRLDGSTAIRAFTRGSGAAGSVRMTAGSSLEIRGDASVRTESRNRGNAGAIFMEGQQILLADSSSVSSSAEFTEEGGGDAGQILLNGGTVCLQDSAGIKTETDGKGNAGDIFVNAENLRMQNQSSLSSASRAASLGGDAGTIAVRVQDSLFLGKGTYLTTDAESAGGGLIQADAGNIFRMDESIISTSVHKGSGSGGDIYIGDTEKGMGPRLLTLNHSRIQANADEGDGGAVFIVTDNYVKSADSIVEASSRRGNDGSVRVESPDTDISGGLISLPSDYPDAARWVETPCSQRSAENISRFVKSGRDGIPFFPDDYRSSCFFLSAFFQEKKGSGKKFPGLIQKGNIAGLIRVLESAEKDTADAVLLARAYAALGRYSTAEEYMQEISSQQEIADSPAVRALYYNCMGDLRLLSGDMKNAIAALKTAREAAEMNGESEITAAVLNNLGILRAVNRDYAGAVRAYEEALELTENPRLHSLLLLNMSRTRFAAGQYGQAVYMSEKAEKIIRDIPGDFQKALDLLSLMTLYFRMLPPRPSFSFTDSGEEALRIGQSIGNRLILSSAGSLLAQYYILQKQPEKAFPLIRRALFSAGQSDHPEILYRLQWQLGKLFRQSGETERALPLYREAVKTLHPIRMEFFRGIRDRKNVFGKNVKPVFQELTALLLEKFRNSPSSDSETLLQEVGDYVELLKTSEVEDFFRDECIAADSSSAENLRTSLPPGTAVLYPILLPDHLALILVFPDSMKYIRVPAYPLRIMGNVRKFREMLEEGDDNFQETAIRLYDSLIRPAEKELAEKNTDTLVISPDGPLRMIPLAALYDGKHYLAEKYALATVLSASLTSPGNTADTDAADRQILLSGLSHAREDFAPLPYVREELENIRSIMKGSVLLDEDFTLKNIKAELQKKKYSFVHLATHAVFGKTYEDSFLLTYDGRLTMENLDRLVFSETYLGNPPELLTLSACETAMGDDRAVFGLAGVALRSGAKSALGTLWAGDDQATFLIADEFYRQMAVQGNTKARALQMSQKRLIETEEYAHPMFWAPFLLIGNWR
jgi:filamentous hemagglutinin family protein